MAVDWRRNTSHHDLKIKINAWVSPEKLSEIDELNHFSNPTTFATLFSYITAQLKSIGSFLSNKSTGNFILNIMKGNQKSSISLFWHAFVSYRE